MLVTALYILTIGCDPPEPITLREFSLATTNGDNVFHEEFDRRRLTDASHRLALKFHAFEQQFEFEFLRYSVFAPDGVVRMTGHVREHRTGAPSLYCALSFFYKPTIHVVHNWLFNQKGKDYVEAPLPDILSFASPRNDAAITFINDTAVNGVVFQHNKAFDIVASANLLLV